MVSYKKEMGRCTDSPAIQPLNTHVVAKLGCDGSTEEVLQVADEACTTQTPHRHTHTATHAATHMHSHSHRHSHTRTRTHVRTCVIVCRPQRQSGCRQVCLGRCQCPPAIRRVCARQTRCLPSQCIGAPCHRLVAHSIAGRETGIIAPQQGVHSVAVTAEGSLAQELPRQPEVPALDGWRVVRIEVVCAQVPDARRTPWYGSA